SATRLWLGCGSAVPRLWLAVARLWLGCGSAMAQLGGGGVVVAAVVGGVRVLVCECGSWWVVCRGGGEGRGGGCGGGCGVAKMNKKIPIHWTQYG
ncbi:hypothetical protein Tco_1258093, partial [Tanacetum coccineum]